ncbi:MAG: hypothetical protein L7U72_03040 [Rubripirellula sp.]|nr:hypothetical protein [Rubripirellula sp.]
MPLRKLWNSLRRHNARPIEKVAQDASVEQSIVKLNGSPDPEVVEAAIKPRTASKHVSELCSTLQKLEPETILEIGVGDGQRALEYLSGLRDLGSPVRYFAIDQFELADGELSLREFHQMLRNAGIRPQIFPEPVAAGLTRFLHTIGSADVVLLNQPIPEVDIQQVNSLLRRISNDRTSILSLNDGKQWVPMSIGLDSDRLAA